MRLLAVLTVVVSLAIAPDAAAQRYRRGTPINPRFGVGFEANLIPDPGQRIVPDGLGLGLHGRIALPLNTDLSAGVGMGMTAFVLSGSDEADYVASPEATLILTLPTRDGGARYLLGGFGGLVPLSDGAGPGAPTLLAGIGWAFPLRETSLYVELAPALVIGRDEATVSIPVRVGVIF